MVTGEPDPRLVEEVVRRVLERLGRSGGGVPPDDAGPVPPAAPIGSGAHWSDRLPPELRGHHHGRWDSPPGGDEGIAVGTPVDGPGAGRCQGCRTPGLCAWVCPATTERVVLEGATRIGAAPDGRALSPGLAGRIDHTLLRADATTGEVDRLCDEVARYGFASVCVNGAWVRHAAERLAGRGLVCAVVGFPLGANLPETKAAETRQAVADGAREIDMVINVGALRSRDHALVARDLAGVVDAAGVPVKVILETGLLSREEKVEACVLAQAAGAAFVKTSTGFGPSGATVDDVRLMRETVGPGVQVKASGGVRDADIAQAMIEAGADRIGASASVAIVEGGPR